VPEGVVVTGIGVVSPLNPDGNQDRFWAALCAGENAVGEIRTFIAAPYPCRVAAEIDREKLPPGDPDSLADPAMRMALAAFRLALLDSGYHEGCYDSRRTGVIVGTVLGGILSGERYLHKDGTTPEERKRLLRQYPLGAIAASLARTARFAGPNLTVSTACASGTDAIGIAWRRISAGSADLLVAGGVDALCEFSFSGFCALQALTPDRVRPFSRNRNGLAIGEGAAFLVMEREEAAAKRGAKILGRVAGYASRSDATHLTAPHREGRGLAAAAAAALAEAGIPSDRVGYVNAHGTGTLYNDWMETRAIGAVLGKRARTVPVSSIKGSLGHAFGAAGAMEATACLLSMRDGFVPPTANFEEADPDCDLDCVPNRGRKEAVRVALSLSAGFGGQNAALVLCGDPG
jgi:3-oxoacyl-(acyl-carrier-protein) synthase